jgi:hypothetical protein
MKYTGETAVRLAEKYGLPIHKRPDEDEGYREDIPLEDAQRMLRNGTAEAIFVEAEPELAARVSNQDELVRDRPRS